MHLLLWKKCIFYILSQKILIRICFRICYSEVQTQWFGSESGSLQKCHGSGIQTLKLQCSQKNITRALYFLTSQSPDTLVGQRPAALVVQRPAALVVQRPAALLPLTNLYTIFWNNPKDKGDKKELKSLQPFPFLHWWAPPSLGLEAHVAAIRAGKLKSDDTH